MCTVDLSLIELGIHEELVACVADQQDYYAEEGAHVALRDGRAWDHDRLRRTATIGLGRVLVAARALSAVAEELAVPRVPDSATIYRTQLPEEKSWPTHGEWPS